MRRWVALVAACSAPPAVIQPAQPEPPRKSIVPSIRWVDSITDAGATDVETPDADVVATVSIDAASNPWADSNDTPSQPDEPEVEYENGIAIYRMKAPAFCFADATTSFCHFDRARCDKARTNGQWRQPTRCAQSSAMVCVRYRKTTTGDRMVICTREIAHCRALVAEASGPDFEFGECEVLRYKK